MPGKPVAVDLFCGLGGWTDGLLAEGYDVTGYDIEAHEYGDERYPAKLVLQDVLTIDGADFAHADLIVASPPCQAYSYMAMPWGRAKAKAAAIRADETGAALERLNALFAACFRIQRQASAAAGRRVPLVVENVKGAQPWVGRAAWNFGSYYLWGDVPALMPGVVDGRKVPGFRFDGAGGSFQTAAVADGRKHHGDWFRDPACPSRQGGQIAPADGRKQRGSGREWFAGEGTIGRTTSSNSPARKAASARIAKIPFALSSHIARVYRPDRRAAA